MNPLFDYMTNDEYDIAVESAMFENTALRFDQAFAITEMNHKVRMSNIETKAIVENYNDYDLEKMYTHEMQVYTESVAEVWDRFIKWLKGIWAALLGKVKLIDKSKLGDDEVEVPVNPKGLIKFSQELRAKLKQFKEDHIDGNEGKISIVFGGIAATGIVAFVVDGVKKGTIPTKIKKKEIPQLADEIQTEGKAYEPIVENAKTVLTQPGTSEEKKEAVGFLKTAVTKISEALQNAANILLKKSENKDAPEDTAKPANNQKGDSNNQNADSTQTSGENSEKSDDTQNDDSSDNKQGEPNKEENNKQDEATTSDDEKKHIKLPDNWDDMNKYARRNFLLNAGVSKKGSEKLSKLYREKVLKKMNVRTRGKDSVIVAFEHAIKDSERVFSGVIDAVNLDIDAYLTEASGADYKELQELAASLID